MLTPPELYKTTQAPYYHTGLTGNLVVLCIMVGVIVLQTLYLVALNKRNVKRRAALGKTGAHVDFSLESSKRWQELREQQQAANKTDGTVEASYNDQAFLDLTDLQNEDFIYSL